MNTRILSFIVCSSVSFSIQPISIEEAISCGETIITAAQVLGVEPDASVDAIKKAYRAQSFKNHPDRNTALDAVETMQKINAARETLLNPQRSVIYSLYQNAMSYRKWKQREIFLGHVFLGTLVVGGTIGTWWLIKQARKPLAKIGNTVLVRVSDLNYKVAQDLRNHYKPPFGTQVFVRHTSKQEAAMWYTRALDELLFKALLIHHAKQTNIEQTIEFKKFYEETPKFLWLFNKTSRDNRLYEFMRSTTQVTLAQLKEHYNVVIDTDLFEQQIVIQRFV